METAPLAAPPRAVLLTSIRAAPVPPEPRRAQPAAAVADGSRHRKALQMARHGRRSRRGATALRVACALALAHGVSARALKGIFNIFQASLPPTFQPPLPPPAPNPPQPPPACAAGLYKFSTGWIAPVAASVVTRLGLPPVRCIGRHVTSASHFRVEASHLAFRTHGWRLWLRHMVASLTHRVIPRRRPQLRWRRRRWWQPTRRS